MLVFKIRAQKTPIQMVNDNSANNPYQKYKITGQIEILGSLILAFQKIIRDSN